MCVYQIVYAKLDSRRKRVSQLSERNEDLGNEKQYEDEVWEMKKYCQEPSP